MWTSLKRTVESPPQEACLDQACNFSTQEHQVQMANELGPQCLSKQALCCNWPNINRYNANIMFFKNLLEYILQEIIICNNYSLNVLTHQHHEGNSTQG